MISLSGSIPCKQLVEHGTLSPPELNIPPTMTTAFHSHPRNEGRKEGTHYYYSTQTSLHHSPPLTFSLTSKMSTFSTFSISLESSSSSSLFFTPNTSVPSTAMDSIVFLDPLALARFPAAHRRHHHHHRHRRHHHFQLPLTLTHQKLLQLHRRPSRISRRRFGDLVASAADSGMSNSSPPRGGVYTVGDFMTKKEDLHVVKTTTTVDEALETLVDKRITGFPVIDDDWKLVGVVSDYDLLALDSISGGGQADVNLFPDVDSSWKTFNKIQRLLSKTHGKVVGDLMTPAPLVVCETTNLEDAVRLLLETKYRRLPVVDSDGRLVGIITRGNVVRAALQIQRSSGRYHN